MTWPHIALCVAGDTCGPGHVNPQTGLKLVCCQHRGIRWQPMGASEEGLAWHNALGKRQARTWLLFRETPLHGTKAGSSAGCAPSFEGFADVALPVWRHVTRRTPVEEIGERTTLGAGREAQDSESPWDSHSCEKAGFRVHYAGASCIHNSGLSARLGRQSAQRQSRSGETPKLTTERGAASHRPANKSGPSLTETTKRQSQMSHGDSM